MKFFEIIFVLLLFILSSCKGPLQEETFSTLGPNNFYNSADDAETLLNGVYAKSQGYPPMARDYLTFGEMTTDILIERGGAINANTQPVEDFEWTSTQPWLDNLWTRYYTAIYRANTVLDKIPDINMNENRKEEILAEARFLRALNYYYLHDLFGTVPIIETSETTFDDNPSRPTEEVFNTFIENEFTAVSKVLPASQEEYGRATSGAALGFLCKFYLNNRKWEKTAEISNKIIFSKQYTIFDTGNRTDLFALRNEGNSEFIYVAPFPNSPGGDEGNSYINHAAPPGYQFKYPPKINFAAQFKIRSDFLNLFKPKDERLDAFISQYVNQAGDTVRLGHNDVRSFKYPEDPNGVGSRMGNDFPLLRYADILLSRAEALNELNGPNQESINLINEIREAAGVDYISLAGYSSKEALRNFILDERGREFHTEALRRQDLIRQGKFIKKAKDRGLAAEKYQLLFPIPQAEIDRNPNLEQNPGY